MEHVNDESVDANTKKLEERNPVQRDPDRDLDLVSKKIELIEIKIKPKID